MKFSFQKGDAAPAHQRIADEIRKQIVRGELGAGTRLPATIELAAAWNTSIFTIHTALKTLVKQGWIDRRRGAGTRIANPKSRFVRAGIYHESDIGSEKYTSFSRNLHFSLLGCLERIGKDTQIFFDSRPEQEQGTIMPALSEAIASRRIQCLIAPTINPYNAPVLAELTLPTAFVFNPFSPNQVDLDVAQLFRESMKRFVAQGCGTVGLISNIPLNRGKNDPFTDFYPCFHRMVREHGLATSDEWILRPEKPVDDYDLYGYMSFKRLWKSRRRPEALIILPDSVVHGAILAVLEIGLARVRQRMKFVFHRNEHIRLLCPFEVTWAVSNEETMAEGLVGSILRQFDGEKISPILIPYVMKENTNLTETGTQDTAVPPALDKE